MKNMPMPMCEECEKETVQEETAELMAEKPVAPKSEYFTSDASYRADTGRAEVQTEVGNQPNKTVTDLNNFSCGGSV